LIAVCMRATGQVSQFTGTLAEPDRRIVAARAILGEWIGGSGGGWQRNREERQGHTPYDAVLL